MWTLSPRGPDWMPITPKTGSLFHAETHCGVPPPNSISGLTSYCGNWPIPTCTTFPHGCRFASSYGTVTISTSGGSLRRLPAWRSDTPPWLLLSPPIRTRRSRFAMEFRLFANTFQGSSSEVISRDATSAPASLAAARKRPCKRESTKSIDVFPAKADHQILYALCVCDCSWALLLPIDLWRGGRVPPYVPGHARFTLLQMLAPPLFASRSFWFLLSDFDEGSADAISGFVFFLGHLVGVIKTNPWPNVLFNSGFACSHFRFGFSSKYTGATPCFWHNRKYSPLVMVLIIVMPSMLEITSTSMIGFDPESQRPAA